MFRSFWKLYFGVVINAALGKELEKPGPKTFGSEGSCWSVGFTFETCCAPEFGSEGNTECWDDVYTFESCCQSDGDPKKVGCNSSYFQRFRSLALDYYNLGWSKPALIELWPRILANYNARFVLCPPAALQAQLLQIEERGFLERPEKVIDKLLVFLQCFWVSFYTICGPLGRIGTLPFGTSDFILCSPKVVVATRVKSHVFQHDLPHVSLF